MGGDVETDAHIGISVTSVKREMKKLAEGEIIIRKGSRKSVYWEIR